MDRDRFSAIAHGDLTYWNPVGAPRLDQLLAALQLPTDARVLDIGCGRGTVLCRLAERHPAINATGVDPSPFAHHLALDAASAAGVAQQVNFLQTPYQAEDHADNSQDLVIVFGASHAVGSFEQSLKEAHRVLRPGGQLLLAEGYWQTTPSAAYLDFLGMQEQDMLTHQGNLSHCQKAGFSVTLSMETTLAEWDDYENSYAANILRYLDQHPGDADAEAMRERITTWHDGYLRLGRGVLGFAVYLLKKA